MKNIMTTSVQIPKEVYEPWKQHFPLWGQMSKSIVIVLALAMTNESFLAKVAGLMEAIQEGEADYYEIIKELME